jgi:hypothetical protein
MTTTYHFTTTPPRFEYAIWGIPPEYTDEQLLLTSDDEGNLLTDASNAERMLQVLVNEHGITNARIQSLDISANPSAMFTSSSIIN